MSQHVDKKTGRWFFKCYIDGKAKIRRQDENGNQFTRKRDAKASEALFLSYFKAHDNHEVLSDDVLKWIGLSANVITKDMLLSELADEFRVQYVRSKKQRTIEKFDSILKLHILPFFGEMKVIQIHQRDVLKWKDEMIEKNLSKTHLDHAYIHLRSILEFAVRYHELPKNVAALSGTFDIKANKKEVDFWEAEEFENFIKVFDLNNEREFETFVIMNTFFYTGFRAGELLGLQWKDLDKENQTLTINKAVSRTEISTPKTQSSNRTVKIPKHLFSLLTDYKERKKRTYGFNEEFYMFGSDKFMSKNTLDNRWRAALDKSEVKRIKLHDLRHSHASLLFRNEYNILYISKRLGHATMEQTMNTYVHLSKELSERDDKRILELK